MLSWKVTERKDTDTGEVDKQHRRRRQQTRQGTKRSCQEIQRDEDRDDGQQQQEVQHLEELGDREMKERER